VAGLREIERDDRGLLFTGQRRGEFLAHLRSKLSDRHSGARAADELLSGATLPSKQLMSVAAEEVRERQQFVLLDEQQVAYRLVLKLGENGLLARVDVTVHRGHPLGRVENVAQITRLGVHALPYFVGSPEYRGRERRRFLPRPGGVVGWTGRIRLQRRDGCWSMRT
jgi:hypothetical protein